MITIITSVSFNSLHELYEHCLEHGKYIGFEAVWGDKYMVVKTSNGFLAVRPLGIFSSEHNQHNYAEGYKLFNTKEELLDWMK